MSDTPSRLDGNVTAGALATVFSFEVTTARCTWAACRKTAVLAGLHVYVDAPGIVVRCASCEAVVLRYAEPRVVGHAWRPRQPAMLALRHWSDPWRFKSHVPTRASPRGFHGREGASERPW